jgi:hypothetical protein
MMKTVITTSAVAMLALAGFAYGGGNGDEAKGKCVSECARAAAEHRKECARNSDTDQELSACMAKAQEHFKECKEGCSTSEDDE